MAHRFGLIAVLGKPNVGKSTLVNALVGQKVSIVSSKPQTTRRRVLGIVQGESYQIGLVDTPGIHEAHTRLGKAMIDSARQALGDVDAVLIVVDASHKPDELDQRLADLLKKAAPDLPKILCLNKMDRLKPEFVLSHTEAFQSLFSTDRWMLTVATDGTNLEKLLGMLIEACPEGEPRFGEDDFTDQTSRFMAAELIRERVLLGTKEEVPHATAVRIDTWDESKPNLVRIEATLIVEKPGQRAILIGRGGRFIKTLGTEARLAIEELLDTKVFLELHVVARENWRMNPRMLAEAGYGIDD